MAIEFHCPYCTAAIRVPDAFSGKKGSCPKCATKLIVPDVAPPGAPSLEESTAEAPPLAAESIPAATTASPPTTSEMPAAFVPPVVSVDDTAASPEVAISDADISSFAPAAAAPSALSRSLRKKTRRKKSQRLYAIGIPVVCFLLFFGMIGIIMILQTPELKGTLRGTVATAMQIPPKTVSWADLQMTSDEQAMAMSAFDADPEAFVSSQMTCRISLDGNGLAVDLKIGDGFSLFAVNPTNDMTAASWLRDHQVQLNKQRLQQIAAAGAELCQDKITRSAGTPVVFNAERYRDAFGLNTHVKALGFAVEAVAQERKSLCVHENSSGMLYFALPNGTTSFTLRGRSVDGQLLFPGEYTVTLPSIPSEPVAGDATPEDTGISPDSAAESDDKVMQEDQPTKMELSPDAEPPQMVK